MKKQKLNLKNLNVKSFVTGAQVRGGSNITCHPTNCLNTGTVTGPGATGETCGNTCDNTCGCNSGGCIGTYPNTKVPCPQDDSEGPCGGVETFYTACPTDVYC